MKISVCSQRFREATHLFLHSVKIAVLVLLFLLPFHAKASPIKGGFWSGSRICFEQYRPYFSKRGHAVFSIDTNQIVDFTGIRRVVSSMGWYDWKKSNWKDDGFIPKKLEHETSPISFVRHANSGFLLIAG